MSTIISNVTAFFDASDALYVCTKRECITVTVHLYHSSQSTLNSQGLQHTVICALQ